MAVHNTTDYRRVFIVGALIAVAVVIVITVAFIAYGPYQPSLRPLSLPSSSPEQLTVPLQTKYENPFEKSASYTNPFSQYKNPFDVAE